ncbi:M20/M25/M40 family metallo-hydrolase [Alteribacter keqinensis]|uniref:M20/M25/M40 family metallo-hydrolase n=1 Tax=Alteribacter keqinensis TaxID=2483800 RepID=A0A3M7TWQ1_9BACI|nr:M20/M25/M40 family metallo-hydrolase [Alteribacter keqinensis]RNA69332.1 M20/M25/M40 family metallo-hydrolase [Alteribacter keqinensis]
MSSQSIRTFIKEIAENEKVRWALEEIKKEASRTLEDQIEITEIEAPTFEEETRGKVYALRLEEAGIENISTDKHGNVFGVRKGTGKGPKIVVCAHLDTVFPSGTPVKATWKEGKIYAPGIADDGRGLAVVLTLARVMKKYDLRTVGDLIIGATVGEEGLGDLYGVKGLFETRNDIDGFISIEPGSPSRIIFAGTGSRRHKVTFTGKGGHSFGDFGTPSAIHALGRAVGEIAEIAVPEEPKTTFNVGAIQGGTTVNTIAEKASMVIDLRSTDPKALKLLEDKVLTIIKKAALKERHERSGGPMDVDIELVGDRPAGTQSSKDPIVQTAAEAVRQIGLDPLFSGPISTDSNVPISLGVPSLTLGGGGAFGSAHTLNEYFDPTDAYFGPWQILLTVLALAGMEDVSEPVLKK